MGKHSACGSWTAVSRRKRTCRRCASYLVGTPRGRLSTLERELATKPWQEARPEVKVKLLPQDEELYVFVQSEARIGKERSMRRKKLK